MRRSICFCEPNTAYAGEVNNWKFIYTPASSLPKGTRLRFDTGSKGRVIDWEVPSSNLKDGSNVIYAQLENGKILQAREIEIPGRLVPDYEFVLPNEVSAGKTITIVMGATKDDKNSRKNHGNKAQTNSQRRRPFQLYIDTSGKGNFDEPEIFTMDIRGSELHAIRVVTPSFVSKNKRFDVIARFEDEYGNLTNSAPEDTLIELSHESLRENLNWKLFVPETGFINLPNLYFNEPGVYTIQLKNMATNEVFRSFPIRCFSEQQGSLFWGLLHGESERVDSTENIESCLRHFRDEKGFNFFGTSPFENQEETSNEVWKSINQNIADFYEEDRFTTISGLQWVGSPKTEGTRTLLFNKEQKQVLRKKDAKFASLQKLYKSFAPKELISIPCFTMAKGYEYNFEDFAPDFERVVEIYNAWGSSENTAKEGNTVPITGPAKTGINETAEGSIQRALLKNCRFGFVAGGLDDRDIYADLFDSDQTQYPPGLTAIIAKEHTRDSLFEALYNRSCYATTGERMLLGFNISGIAMGKETSTAEKAGFLVNRHIVGYAAGTTTLSKVEIIRNGEVIKTFTPDHYAFEFTFDDMEALEKIAIKSKDKRPPFIFYYIRATQEDGHMAWSSPIWIDLLPVAPPKDLKRAVKAPVKKIIEEDFEEEDEDDEDDYADIDLDDEDDDDDK